MSTWILPLLLIVFAGLAVVLSRVFLLGMAGWIIVWMRASCAFVCIVVAGFCALISYDLTRFESVSAEPMAVVSMQAIDTQTFVVKVDSADGESRHVTLEGDAWQIAAKGIRWGGLFRLVNAKPVYRLDTIKSRFFAFEDKDRGKEISVDRSVAANVVDSWTVFNRFAEGLKGLGMGLVQPTAAYVPAVDGAIYEIYSRHDRLEVKAVNTVAQNATPEQYL